MEIFLLPNFLVTFYFVQGVQLHTHFLAPPFSKDQVLYQKHTKLHTQILVASAGSV